MTKLSQVVAIEKDVKGQTSTELNDAYHQFQKSQPLTGISRTYRPKDDEGEQLPSESTRVQIRAEDVIREVSQSLTRLFDITATKDWSNLAAKGTVRVGGVTLVEDAPVPFLLFLEKQLQDLRTFITKLPTLDLGEEWGYSEEAAAWATKPQETTRTKKVPRNHVKAEATDKFPAQVETYHEDIVVGYWKTIRFSGALPADRVKELTARVTALQEAVKFAREEANSVAVTDKKVGKIILDYLFA